MKNGTLQWIWFALAMALGLGTCLANCLVDQIGVWNVHLTSLSLMALETLRV